MPTLTPIPFYCCFDGIIHLFFVCPGAFPVVCSVLGAQGSEATYSSELARATGGPASGEGLQSSASYDDEVEEEVSGGDHESFHLPGKTIADVLHIISHFWFPLFLKCPRRVFPGHSVK